MAAAAAQRCRRLLLYFFDYAIDTVTDCHYGVDSFSYADITAYRHHA